MYKFIARATRKLLTFADITASAFVAAGQAVVRGGEAAHRKALDAIANAASRKALKAAETTRSLEYFLSKAKKVEAAAIDAEFIIRDAVRIEKEELGL